jgi:hypothetical protein
MYLDRVCSRLLANDQRRFWLQAAEETKSEVANHEASETPLARAPQRKNFSVKEDPASSFTILIGNVAKFVVKPNAAPVEILGVTNDPMQGPGMFLGSRPMSNGTVASAKSENGFLYVDAKLYSGDLEKNRCS